MLLYLRRQHAKQFFWRIDDGRIWNAAEGTFLQEVPEGEATVSPNGSDDKPMTYDGLPWLVNFYNSTGHKFPLGELVGLPEMTWPKS